MDKRIGTAIGIVALVALVGLAAALIGNQAARPVAAQETEPAAYNTAKTITVIGQGSVKVKPDIARISIGAETLSKTVGEAVTENEAKMESLLAALKAAGIAEKDIQTAHYSIQFERYAEAMPVVEDSEAKEAKTQYRVSNMVNVTVRDLEKVDEVLDAVIEAGANNIWGVSFSLDDPEAAQSDARAKAIANALSRAEALAGLSEVKLGPVMSISEVVGGGSVPVAYDMVERAAMGGAGTISPGEVEIGYQIQVVYFIEP